eukprot:2774721-Amphidinium_carterae.1
MELINDKGVVFFGAQFVISWVVHCEAWILRARVDDDLIGAEFNAHLVPGPRPPAYGETTEM